MFIYCTFLKNCIFKNYFIYFNRINISAFNYMFFLENDHYSKTCNCEKTTNKMDHMLKLDM